jgi:hypothetical protein
MGKDHETAAVLTNIGATAALGITTFFCPPLGAAMAISSTVVGGASAAIGAATDDNVVRDIGLAYLGAGVGAWAGGGSNLTKAHNCNLCKFAKSL